MVCNAMSVDVEDWFQVQAFADVIDRAEWDKLESRVVRNTERVLAMFADRGVKATFFTLGWVAERYPGLVRSIVADGHELASHGYGHELVRSIGKERFRQDIARAKRVLEDCSGASVIGYRAPTFSIGEAESRWAYDVLFEEGYLYSSSIFPISHDLYGSPSASRHPYRAGEGKIMELPMTTVRAGRRNWPCSGGGWFRILPYTSFSLGIRHVNHSEHAPAIFYFHPWEIDPDQPRVQGASRMSRFRHYTGLHQMEQRISRLLAEFEWGRMDQVFGFQAGRPVESHPI